MIDVILICHVNS